MEESRTLIKGASGQIALTLGQQVYGTAKFSCDTHIYVITCITTQVIKF